MRHLLYFTFMCLLSFSQPCVAQDSLMKPRYEKALADIKEALDNKIDFDFKHIVFLTENTYLSDQLDYLKFNERICQLKMMAQAWMRENPLQNYSYKDSNDLHKNLAIYKILKDTIWLTDGSSTLHAHLPFTYDFNDFNDFTGTKDWSKMFVTKLLATKTGNCRSLPYLYKILADELGTTCWLSLAPNHIYIKNRCKKNGWYNTELTSGEFPIDAWITTSGYVPLNAIQTGLYMDTLSNKQAIALCVLDLAKGYQFQTKNYFDGFIIKCCDLVLQHHPVNVQALLLKAETLKRVYEKQSSEKNPAAKDIYGEMEQLYVKLFDLGYREMPEKMYMEWLISITKQRSKYGNKELKTIAEKRKNQ